ncbi:MAG TPA: hypothetical protein VGJ26_22020 [Pirellulales bacterium]|jgi:hypothetical protein
MEGMKLRFPWNTVIALAVLFVSLVFSVALFGEFKVGMGSPLGDAACVALLMAVGLAIVVLLIHASYKLVEAVFRLNRPKFGPPQDLHPGEPFE